MTTSQQRELTPHQRRMAHWASEIITMGNFCFIDTKTTGLKGQVIDIAIVGPDGNAVLNQLVRPTIAIEPKAMEIHRITEEMLATAPSFGEVWPQIFEVLTPYRCILTYGADFDSRVLLKSAEAAGLRVHLYWKKMFAAHDAQFVIPGMWQCLMDHYAEFYGSPGRFGPDSYRWQKLHEACQQQGIEHHNWHRALGDAQAAWKLLQVMAAQYVAPGEEVQG